MVNPNDQISEAVRLAEENRRQAKADADRQIADMRQRSEWMHGMSIQAMQQRAISGLSNIAQPARSLGSALGYPSLGADILTQHGVSMPYQVATYGGYSPSYGYGGGPLGRPVAGGFTVTGQSFMGMFYDLYLSPFAGSTKLGHPGEIVAARQEKEISRRLSEVMHGFNKYTLPLFGYFRSSYDASRVEFERDVESRFGHVVAAANAPGGRGVDAAFPGQARAFMAGALTSSFAQLEGSGYAYSTDEMVALDRAAMSVFGSADRSNIVENRTGYASGLTARQSMNTLVEKLRLDAEKASEFAKAYGGLLYGPEGFVEVAKDVTTAIENNLAGGLTGYEMGNMLSVIRQQNNRLGMTAEQSRAAALGTVTLRGSILESYKSGLISREALFAYGGNSQDEAALLFTQAQQRAGLMYGLSNPAIAGMFASARGRSYMANMVAGRGPDNQVDFLTTVAQNVVNDPYGGLRAKFSGQSRQAALDMGFSAAVADAEREVNQMPMLTNDPQDREALVLERLSTKIGEQDPVKVRRQYEAEKSRIKQFSGGGVSEQTARERAAIYKSTSLTPGLGANFARTKAAVVSIHETMGYDKFSSLTEAEQIYALQAALAKHDANPEALAKSLDLPIYTYKLENFKDRLTLYGEDPVAFRDSSPGSSDFQYSDPRKVSPSMLAKGFAQLGGPLGFVTKLKSAGYTDAEINAALDRGGSSVHVKNGSFVSRTREDYQVAVEDLGDLEPLYRNLQAVLNASAEDRALANIKGQLEGMYGTSVAKLFETTAEFTGGSNNETYSDGSAQRNIDVIARKNFATDAGLNRQTGMLEMTDNFRSSAANISRLLMAQYASDAGMLEKVRAAGEDPEALLSLVNSTDTARNADEAVMTLIARRALGVRAQTRGHSEQNPMFVKVIKDG